MTWPDVILIAIGVYALLTIVGMFLLWFLWWRSP